MLASVLIVFREALEAGLIIGIVLAAARGLPGRFRLVGLGVLAGAAGAVGVGVLAGFAENGIPAAHAGVMNASILGLAVLLLGWHVVWMGRHSRAMTRDLREVGEAVRVGTRPATALAFVVGLAVLREGSELVLFLAGIAAAGGTSPADMVVGSVVGMAAALGLGVAIYLGLTRIPVHRFFAVTNGLVTVVAAGLAAQAAGALQQGGLVAVLTQRVWNSSALLSQESIPGKMLHVLIGYSDRPSALQLLAYIATLAVLLTLGRLAAAPAPVRG